MQARVGEGMGVLERLAAASFGSLIAVWIGYPVVMAAIASRKRAGTSVPRTEDPTVSVVIATRDDAQAVQARVADCIASHYDPAKLEVVVAVDRRSPGAAIADSYLPSAARDHSGGCTVVLGDEPGGKAATLNAGVRASRGAILVFTDTHQRFDPDAIHHLVSSLGDPGTGASSGRLELPCENGHRSLVDKYWAFERWLRRCEATVHSSVGVTGAIWALRRSLWTPLESCVILDDVYAPMQLVLRGYRVAYTEPARAVETRQPAPVQEFHRKVRTLTGVIQLCVQMPTLLIPTRNPIWPQFVFHKLLRLLTPYWVLAIAAWMSSLAARWCVTQPLAAAGVFTAGLAGTFSTRGRVGSVMSRVRSTVVWGALLQAAVVKATANGIRRRWDVWHT